VIRRLHRHVRALTHRLLRETQGTIALKFALLVPAIALLSVGAVDLFAVTTAQTRLQAIADAGALAGAPALALATDGAAARERSAAFVAGQLSEWSDAPTVVETYEIVTQGGQRGIRVLLQANRQSFFVNMLPPGGWNFKGDATATSVGLVPLCVLVTGTQANRDIEVSGGAITAAAVQAVTSAGGAISPAANTGAAPIDDPFANLELEQASGLGTACRDAEATSGKVSVSSGVHYISPGNHCGGIEATGDARIVLQSGEHYFLRGNLLIGDSARLEGSDVILLFDTASRFAFTAASRVNLEGRQSGDFAGIVMASMRDNQQDFLISADHVESLLGVIYVPSARLIVEGSADVARDSAWTVIVAKELRLSGSPSLYINANYDASSVPVPNGVGPRTGGSRLIN
jgi:hypothetical protein